MRLHLNPSCAAFKHDRPLTFWKRNQRSSSLMWEIGSPNYFLSFGLGFACSELGLLLADFVDLGVGVTVPL